jgi:hypothetical protein
MDVIHRSNMRACTYKMPTAAFSSNPVLNPGWKVDTMDESCDWGVPE